MAITTTTNKQIALGNGVNTAFVFPFTVRQKSDIKVLYVDANGNETDVTANCVIALNAVAPGSQWAVGGTVTYNPPAGAIALGTQLTIIRVMPLTQGTIFSNQGGNFPTVTEQTADVLEMAIQQLQEQLNRTALLSQGKDSSLYTLTLTPVANGVLGWDAAGKALGTVAGSGGVNIVLPGAPGMAVYTGGSTFISRTLTAGQGMAVVNGTGVAGDPVVSQAGGSQVIVDANPTVWNSNLGMTGVLTATNAVGNLRTVALPTNIVAGNYYVLRFIQDATGGRGITWPATIKGFNGAVSPPQPNPTISAETDFFFYSADGASLQLVVPPVIAFGQCYLSKSGANLLLSPKGGTYLTINGKVEVIPDAGVTLGIGAAAANTTYNIYAFMNAGVMTLEFSATAHATQAGTGIEIKTGDGTRTLVGMARTSAGPAWEDDNALLGVLSYFNRHNKSVVNGFTTSRTTTSGTYVEINTEIRGNFLTWGDEAVAMTISGGTVTSTGSVMQTSFGINGIAPVDAESECNSSATVGACALSYSTIIAEGFNYATLLGLIGGGTATWQGAAIGGRRTALNVTVRG